MLFWQQSHNYTCPHCGPIDSLIPTPAPSPGQEQQDDQLKEAKKEDTGKEGGGEGGSGVDTDADMAARIAQMVGDCFSLGVHASACDPTGIRSAQCTHDGLW